MTVVENEPQIPQEPHKRLYAEVSRVINKSPVIQFSKRGESGYWLDRRTKGHYESTRTRFLHAADGRDVSLIVNAEGFDDKHLAVVYIGDGSWELPTKVYILHVDGSILAETLDPAEPDGGQVQRAATPTEIEEMFDELALL